MFMLAFFVAIIIGCANGGFAPGPPLYFVYVANDGDGTISAYSINSATGALTQVTGSPFTAGTNPRSVAVDPTARFFVVFT